jgi:phosphohistidine phosphatase
MRYLTIVRHAKAAAAESGQSDFDRPLTARGRAQCEMLRTWANDPRALGAYGPVTALVSAAARTRETYAVAYAGTTFVHALSTSELIYNGKRDVSAEDVLAELAAIDPVTESLMVVGHNPTVYELATLLSGGEIPELHRAKYPTACAIVLALPDDETVGLRRYDYVRGFIPEV